MSRRLRSAIGLALLAMALPCAGQELGRLFFTPEQREQLDARRKARVPDKPAAPVVASPTTRLDGYVKRSSGPSPTLTGTRPSGRASTRGASDVPSGIGWPSMNTVERPSERRT